MSEGKTGIGIPNEWIDERTQCRVEATVDVVALTWPIERGAMWARRQFQHAVEETAAQQLEPELFVVVRVQERHYERVFWDPETDVEAFLKEYEDCDVMHMDLDGSLMCWYRECETLAGNPEAMGFALSETAKLGNLELLLSNTLLDDRQDGIDPLIEAARYALADAA